MQRRQLLKLLLPLSLAVAGLAAGLSQLKTSACKKFDLAELLKQLKPFSDDLLGKAINMNMGASELKPFEGLCDDSFADGYRQLVVKDFKEGKTKSVDGWILSETEVLTHAIVHRSAQLSH